LVSFTHLPPAADFSKPLGHADPHIFLWEIGQTTILATVGVVIATALTAVFTYFCMGTGLAGNWAAALAFGGMLSATDPVAVVALLKELGAPKQLSLLIEGESLINDGTAMAIFLVFFEMLTGDAKTVGEMLLLLLQLTGGGVLLGLVVGVIVAAWLGIAKWDSTTQITVTLFAAYITFILAEGAFHFSGVIAVVTQGLVLAVSGRTAIKDHEGMHHFWEMIEYIANTLVFVIAGVLIVERGFLTSEITLTWTDLGLSLLLYVVLNAVRYFALFVQWPLLTCCSRHIRGYDLDWRDMTVVGWAGLRGAVGLVLSLLVSESNVAENFEGNERTPSLFLFHMAVITCLTLLVNGSTTGLIVRYLGIGVTSAPVAHMFSQAVKSVRGAYEEKTQRLKNDEFFRNTNWEVVSEQLEEVFHELEEESKEVDKNAEASGKNREFSFAGFFQFACRFCQDQRARSSRSRRRRCQRMCFSLQLTCGYCREGCAATVCRCCHGAKHSSEVGDSLTTPVFEPSKGGPIPSSLELAKYSSPPPSTNGSPSHSPQHATRTLAEISLPAPALTSADAKDVSKSVAIESEQVGLEIAPSSPPPLMAKKQESTSSTSALVSGTPQSPEEEDQKDQAAIEGLFNDSESGEEASDGEPDEPEPRHSRQPSTGSEDVVTVSRRPSEIRPIPRVSSESLLVNMDRSAKLETDPGHKAAIRRRAIMAATRQRYLSIIKRRYWEFHEKGRISGRAFEVLSEAASKSLDDLAHPLSEWKHVRAELGKHTVRAIAWMSRCQDATFKRVEFEYEVCAGFINAHTNVITFLRLVVADDDATRTIEEEEHSMVDLAREFLEDALQEQAVTRAVQTRHAIRVLLTTIEKQAHHLHMHGEIDEKEYDRIVEAVHKGWDESTLATKIEVDDVQQLKEAAFFDELPDSVIDELVHGARSQIKEYASGAVMMRENEHAGGVIIVLAGLVDLWQHEHSASAAQVPCVPTSQEEAHRRDSREGIAPGEAYCEGSDCGDVVSIERKDSALIQAGRRQTLDESAIVVGRRPSFAHRGAAAAARQRSTGSTGNLLAATSSAAATAATAAAAKDEIAALRAELSSSGLYALDPHLRPIDPVTGHPVELNATFGRIIDTLSWGSVVGALSMLTGFRTQLTAIARTRVRALILRQQDIYRLLKSSPCRSLPFRRVKPLETVLCKMAGVLITELNKFDGFKGLPPSDVREIFRASRLLRPEAMTAVKVFGDILVLTGRVLCPVDSEKALYLATHSASYRRGRGFGVSVDGMPLPRSESEPDGLRYRGSATDVTAGAEAGGKEELEEVDGEIDPESIDGSRVNADEAMAAASDTLQHYREACHPEMCVEGAPSALASGDVASEPGTPRGEITDLPSGSFDPEYASKQREMQRAARPRMFEVNGERITVSMDDFTTESSTFTFLPHNPAIFRWFGEGTRLLCIPHGLLKKKRHAIELEARAVRKFQTARSHASKLAYIPTDIRQRVGKYLHITKETNDKAFGGNAAQLAEAVAKRARARQERLAAGTSMADKPPPINPGPRAGSLLDSSPSLDEPPGISARRNDSMMWAADPRIIGEGTPTSPQEPPPDARPWHLGRAIGALFAKPVDATVESRPSKGGIAGGDSARRPVHVVTVPHSARHAGDDGHRSNAPGQLLGRRAGGKHDPEVHGKHGDDQGRILAAKRPSFGSLRHIVDDHAHSPVGVAWHDSQGELQIAHDFHGQDDAPAASSEADTTVPVPAKPMVNPHLKRLVHDGHPVARADRGKHKPSPLIS
jgi:NhaP-type Na+/H+ or K+/H+ antiporter/CRP-like cAMP-binding protein